MSRSSDDEPTVLQVEVTADEAGIRLDRLLAGRLPDRTRSQIQRLIREGQASHENAALRASSTLQPGDIVTLAVPAPEPATPTPEALPLVVVHDDPDIIVVEKPAGMVVHPAAGHATGTLVNALLHHVRDLSGIGGQLRPGIVHRLDRGTSGLMVVAKHDQAHAALSRQFRERDVEKEYLTLVWGEVHPGRRIDTPIGRDPKHRKKISTRSQRPRDAVTRVVKAEAVGGMSFLDVVIDTGRTHQIRVHLSAIGHPVVGDPTYGGVRRHPLPHQRPVQRLERPFLHAAGLSFRHPRDDATLRFASELPTDLRDVLDALRRSDAARGRGRSRRTHIDE